MAAMDVEDAAYEGIWWFVDEIVVGMGGRGTRGEGRPATVKHQKPERRRAERTMEGGSHLPVGGREGTSSADEIAGDVDVRWAEKENLLLLLLVGGRRCGVEEKKKVTSAGVRLGQAVSQSVKSRSNSRIARMTASIIIPRTTKYIKDKIEGIGL
jgi:hypothetical protein